METCIKHVSRSFRSGQHSSSTKSLPHRASTSSNDKDAIKSQESTDANTAQPTYLEFLARPGEDVIALSEQGRRPSSAAERILQPRNNEDLEFPWPAKRDRKRQTIHASWTLSRGVASDGRTNPAAAGVYEPDGRMV